MKPIKDRWKIRQPKKKIIGVDTKLARAHPLVYDPKTNTWNRPSLTKEKQ